MASTKASLMDIGDRGGTSVACGRSRRLMLDLIIARGTPTGVRCQSAANWLMMRFENLLYSWSAIAGEFVDFRRTPRAVSSSAFLGGKDPRLSEVIFGFCSCHFGAFLPPS
jgi:hypothetical protein